MRPLTRSCLVAALLLATSCSGQQASPNIGVSEPLRIESAQFVPGALPGSTQVFADGGTLDPQVPDINAANTVITPGELGLVFSGHATTASQAVGVRFVDLGTGYWVVPVGAPDSTDDGLLTWQIAADFARTLPSGNYNLAFAAIAADGSSGTQQTLTLCIDTPVPDNFHACVHKRAPPAAVLSLSWDTAVNLNVIVETPSGAIIGGSTSETGVPSSTGAVIDHDSNQNCVIDNIDRENVIWQTAPATGTYAVWVDLFSACGKSDVSFNLSLWLPEADGDAGIQLVPQAPLATGVLTAEQATGGSTRGLYVGDFVLR
jgi:hypothetical protein